MARARLMATISSGSGQGPGMRWNRRLEGSDAVNSGSSDAEGTADTERLCSVDWMESIGSAGAAWVGLAVPREVEVAHGWNVPLPSFGRWVVALVELIASL